MCHTDATRQLNEAAEVVTTYETQLAEAGCHFSNQSQFLLRIFTPTQVTESRLRAQVTRSFVIPAIDVGRSGQNDLSAQAACRFCTLTV